MNSAKRRERIERIGVLHKNKERVAGRQLAQTQQQALSSEQTLEQLLDYQREYQQEFKRRSEQGMGVQQFRNFQLFNSQLQQAILQQRETVQNNKAGIEQSRENWLEKRQATEIMSRLSELLGKRVAREEQGQEQRESDEYNSTQRSGN